MTLKERLDAAILSAYGSFERPSLRGRTDMAVARLRTAILESELPAKTGLTVDFDEEYDRGFWLEGPEGEPSFAFSYIGPFYCVLGSEIRLLEAPELGPEATKKLDLCLSALDHPEFVPASLLSKASPLTWLGETASYFAAVFSETDVYDQPRGGLGAPLA
jgi:hypothetical protein